MPLIIADRVLESSTTTGTGVFTLTGASLGFRSFASVCAVSDTVWYYIEGVTAFGVPSGEYEYGLGTYSGANQLTRTTVRGSSNGGSPVNFSAGTKLVGIAPLAPYSSDTKGEWRAALSVAQSGANADITGLSLSAGAALLPSYSFSGDANTGMWSPSADTLAWSTGGTERMRVDSSGNVGIGAAPSTSRLLIEGATSAPAAFDALTLRNTGDGGVGLYFDNAVSLNLASIEALNTTGSGTDDGSLAFSVALNGSNLTRVKFESDGKIFTGGGTGSPYNLTTATAANMVVAADGYLYRSTSSIKYKTNVQDYRRGLADVMALRPVTYQSKGSGDLSARSEKAKKLKEGEAMPEARTFAGFIAEEVHAAGLVEFVEYAEDGTPDALGYAQMTALLVKAIQEQQAQIADLRAAVSKLTNR